MNIVIDELLQSITVTHPCGVDLRHDAGMADQQWLKPNTSPIVSWQYE